MELIWSILFGLLAGVLALLAVYRTFPKDIWGWIGALVIGIIGGWLGSMLFTVLGLEAVNWIGSLVVAFLGGVVILLLIGRLTSQKPAGR